MCMATKYFELNFPSYGFWITFVCQMTMIPAALTTTMGKIYLKMNKIHPQPSFSSVP